MPSYSKRRRGKQGTRSLPTAATAAAAATTSNAAADDEAESTTEIASTSTTINDTDHARPQEQGKEHSQERQQPPQAASAAEASSAITNASNACVSAGDNDSTSSCLVLTSEKRRGVYECDYCHMDISQLPRIRCAVCPDFDLCLTCFANSVATPGREGAGGTMEIGSVSSSRASTSSAAAAAAAVGATTTTTATGKHNPHTHGYRVCDSTRFPLFPTSRNLSLKGMVQNVVAGGGAGGGGGGASSSVASTNKENPQQQQDTEMEAAPVDAATNAGDGGVDGDGEDNVDTTTATNVMDSKSDSVVAQIPPTTNEQDATAAAACTSTSNIESFVLHDDPRNVWTVEEDLRLIDGIRTHGLGNWNDISEAVSGHGSAAKTPKRCMERYLDDFLGRYGHILPPYILLPSQLQQQPQQQSEDANNNTNDESVAADEGATSAIMGAAEGGGADSTTAEPETRASKRRAVLLRSPSSTSNLSYSSNLTSSMMRNKKFKAIPTESLPEYQKLWPYPFLPHAGVTIGQEVGREQAYKAEQTFVKMISQIEQQHQPQQISSSSSGNTKSTDTAAATSANQAQDALEELRREWAETKLCKPGGPTVLPMRPEDVAVMPGAELAGFMPRRGDFDIEFDNDAEQIVADMEFLPREAPQDRELKLKVLAIYNSKLEEREKRKRFVLSRKLYDYRGIQLEQEKLPRDERDLIHRMRLFERFHTPAEHKTFLADLLKAKRLRKEIAKLQMYRRIGIRTLCEAEMYELDKARRAFHKTTQQQQQQKTADTVKTAAAPDAAAADANPATGTTEAMASKGATTTTTVTKASDETVSFSLWKQYRTTDRKNRRSIARGNVGSSEASQTAACASKEVMTASTDTALPVEENKPKDESSDMATEQNQTEGGTQKPESGADDATLEDVCVPPSNVDCVDAISKQQQQESAGTLDKPSPNPAPLNDAISAMPGFQLLSCREADLCRKLQLTPQQYQEIKRELLHESLTQGLLDSHHPSSSSKRSAVYLIDAHRRGNVIDFMVRAGWISTKFAKITRSGNRATATTKSS